MRARSGRSCQEVTPRVSSLAEELALTASSTDDPVQPYHQPEGSEQAGVVTQAAFLAMFSHPGRTSPTKRGVALNEVFLCHVMPLPADNVDFTLINDGQVFPSKLLDRGHPGAAVW